MSSHEKTSFLSSPSNSPLNSTMSTIVPIENGSPAEFSSILKRKTRSESDVDTFLQNNPNTATSIDSETSLPILTYTVQINDEYSLKQLLKNTKISKKFILHALDAAVRKLKLNYVEILLDYWKKYQNEDNREASENFKLFDPDEIMCKACIEADLNPDNPNGALIIQNLFDYGFEILHKFEHPELSKNHRKSNADKSFNDRRILRENRCTDYHYTRYTHLRAKSNPTYIILEHENGTIYDSGDSTIFGNCIALIREIKYQKNKSALFQTEYSELVLKIERFMIKLVDEVHDDTELSYLLHLDLKTVRHEDRNKLPLLKNCCTYELKDLATTKRFQGVVGFITDLHLAWIPKGGFKFLGPIALFLIGLGYPIYTLAYLFNPKSFLGKISHWPKIAFACHAVSEILFAIFILSYSYFSKNYNGQVVYTSIMTVWLFARIMQEFMEFNRSKAYYYLREFWNLLDLVEIGLLVITIVARFVWLSSMPKSDDEIQRKV